MLNIKIRYTLIHLFKPSAAKRLRLICTATASLSEPVFSHIAFDILFYSKNSFLYHFLILISHSCAFLILRYIYSETCAFSLLCHAYEKTDTDTNTPAYFWTIPMPAYDVYICMREVMNN